MTIEDRAPLAATVRGAAEVLGRDCDDVETVYSLHEDVTRELVSAVMGLARGYRDLALEHLDDQLPEAAISAVLDGRRLFASVLMLLASESPAAGLAELRRVAAQDAANARWANDPKSQAKLAVFDYWKRWQATPSLYAKQSEFARDMLGKHDALESDEVVNRWCRQWAKGDKLPS